MINEAVLKRKVLALEKKVAELETALVKQQRVNNDLLFNLDGDNIPNLAAIEKKFRLIVTDGNVNAEVIIEAINGQSKAQINADIISFMGKVFNLKAESVSIVSDNFSVDENGNMTCKNATMEQATIKKSCVLASDASEGDGMQIGPLYDQDGVKRGVKLFSDGNGGVILKAITETEFFTREHTLSIQPLDGISMTSHSVNPDGGDDITSTVSVFADGGASVTVGGVRFVVTDSAILYGVDGDMRELYNRS